MAGCVSPLHLARWEKKKEKKTQTLQYFQTPWPIKSSLRLLSLLARKRRAAHLSSFLDTLDECQAVDLMKVLKAAL